MSSELSNGISKTTFPLEELSKTITENSSIISQYLGANNLPQPSSSDDGPTTVVPSGSPPNIQQARQKLIAAALETLQLAIGPSEFLPNLATGVRLEHISPQGFVSFCSRSKVSICLLPFLALSVRHFPPRALEQYD